MMTEAQAVANKLGITFRVGLEKRIAGAEKVGKHKTSMLQDVEAGRPLEIEALVGSVVELARLTRHADAAHRRGIRADRTAGADHRAQSRQAREQVTRWARFRAARTAASASACWMTDGITRISRRLFDRPTPGRSHAGRMVRSRCCRPCVPSKIVALWNNFHALGVKLGKAAPSHPLYLIKPAQLGRRAGRGDRTAARVPGQDCIRGRAGHRDRAALQGRCGQRRRLTMFLDTPASTT